MLGYGVLGSCARVLSGAAKAQITATTREAPAENVFRSISSSRNAVGRQKTWRRDAPELRDTSVRLRRERLTLSESQNVRLYRGGCKDDVMSRGNPGRTYTE